VFPDQVQVENREMGTSPQEILAEFAVQNHLPAVDLLPILREAAESRENSATDLFKDHSHPSILGIETFAPSIADRIQQEFLPESG
jgi:lysophospholipase L1-like esterase